MSFASHIARREREMAETQQQFKLLGWVYAFAWLMDFAAGRSVWECTDRLRAVHNKPSLPRREHEA